MQNIIIYYNIIVLKGENKSIQKQLKRNPALTPCNTGRSPYGTYYQNNKTQTRILCSQYIAEVSLSRVNEPEQEETDQRVMTLLPALNLEALRAAADTLVPRFSHPKDSYKDNFRSQQCQFLVPSQLMLSEEVNQSDPYIILLQFNI
ncbi:Hypothetical_protein [Hexamita inflata]|uniref:Hypothetical_protein n=1 Tax=Hexamita inflata TaxID=28002 RepID=A0ABP1GV42_9EUKA